MPLDALARDLEVLVVDDESGIRKLLVGYFRARQFRVAGSEDGRAAITTLQRSDGRFGLVVTDLNLPGADGFAVLQAARQANPQCFVVIITGYASLDSAIHAVRVGACDYLTKPFSLVQLDVILERIGDCHAQAPSEHSPLQSRAAVITSHTAPARATEVVPPLRVATIRPEVIDAEVVEETKAGPSSRHESSVVDIDRRLGRLEAAFGRIEALLRERRP